LPVALVSRGGRQAGHRDPRSEGARGRLRHAVRPVEGQVPERSLWRPEEGVRPSRPQALISRPVHGGIGLSVLPAMFLTRATVRKPAVSCLYPNVPTFSRLRFAEPSRRTTRSFPVW